MNADNISHQGNPPVSSPGPFATHSGRPSDGILDDEITLVSSLEESVDKGSAHAQTSSHKTLPLPSLDYFKELEMNDQPVNSESNDLLFGSPKADSPSPPRRSAPVNGGSSSLPSHRARAANPLIKMADDPNFGLGMNTAIAAKARLVSLSTLASSTSEAPLKDGPSRISAFKPPPGRSSQGLQKTNRSSLLVFQKGSLQTRKGKYRPSGNDSRDVDIAQSGSGQMDPENRDGWGDEAMQVDVDLAHLEKAPTSQELLRMAGLSEADAEALPDFEDDGPDDAASLSKHTTTQSRYVLCIQM
jgi:hypothetical protein